VIAKAVTETHPCALWGNWTLNLKIAIWRHTRIVVYTHNPDHTCFSGSLFFGKDLSLLLVSDHLTSPHPCHGDVVLLSDTAYDYPHQYQLKSERWTLLRHVCPESIPPFSGRIAQRILNVTRVSMNETVEERQQYQGRRRWPFKGDREQNNWRKRRRMSLLFESLDRSAFFLPRCTFTACSSCADPLLRLLQPCQTCMQRALSAIMKISRHNISHSR
jgi:hypothetical protein